MGSNEEGKPSKPENSTFPALDQTNIHVYPDWAAMQAYCGPRVALPPYYSSAIASGHASPHPYIWGPPQPMLPPYGPYAAVYSHGGVYVHPAVPLGSHSIGHGIPSSPAASEAMAVTPLSIEVDGKSLKNVDQDLVKKLKGFDGLSMSIGGNMDNAEGGADHGLLLSDETEGSTDDSDGNMAAVSPNGKKRSHEESPTGLFCSIMKAHPPAPPSVEGKMKQKGKELYCLAEGNTKAQGSLVSPRECTSASEKVLGVPVAPAGVSGKIAAMVHSPSMGKLEIENSPTINTQTSPTTVPQPCAMVPSEAWLHKERELKREKRKQSNRESARRSRLRKQVEAEELAVEVETLGAENLSLKSEITRLTKNSEKLRLKNATLLEKLKNANVGKTEEMLLDKVDNKKAAEAVTTENLLSRVSNSSSVIHNAEVEGVVSEKSSKSGAKLHQLLGMSPRADAVAAG